MRVNNVEIAKDLFNPYNGLEYGTMKNVLSNIFLETAKKVDLLPEPPFSPDVAVNKVVPICKWFTEKILTDIISKNFTDDFGSSEKLSMVVHMLAILGCKDKVWQIILGYFQDILKQI